MSRVIRKDWFSNGIISSLRAGGGIIALIAPVRSSAIKTASGRETQTATVFTRQQPWEHTNTIEGVWTTLRNFLRPFRGVHKKFLAGYVAISEFIMNLKVVSVDLIISKLVKSTYS